MAGSASLDRVVEFMKEQINTRICFGVVITNNVGPGGNRLLTVRVGTTADSTTYDNMPTLVNAAVGSKVVWLQCSTGTSVVIGTLV